MQGLEAQRGFLDEEDIKFPSFSRRSYNSRRISDPGPRPHIWFRNKCGNSFKAIWFFSPFFPLLVIICLTLMSGMGLSRGSVNCTTSANSTRTRNFIFPSFSTGNLITEKCLDLYKLCWKLRSHGKGRGGGSIGRPSISKENWYLG